MIALCLKRDPEQRITAVALQERKDLWIDLAIWFLYNQCLPIISLKQNKLKTKV